MDMSFYRCKICGQIIGIVRSTGLPLTCCGEEMEELIPGLSDASLEKHVPVFETDNDRVHVTVGALPHPMTQAHYIEWIAIKTKYGNQRKQLNPGDKPEACFAICEGDEVEAVYAFCNIHSLWKAD